MLFRMQTECCILNLSVKACLALEIIATHNLFACTISLSSLYLCSLFHSHAQGNLDMCTWAQCDCWSCTVDDVCYISLLPIHFHFQIMQHQPLGNWFSLSMLTLNSNVKWVFCCFTLWVLVISWVLWFDSWLIVVFIMVFLIIFLVFLSVPPCVSFFLFYFIFIFFWGGGVHFLSCQFCLLSSSPWLSDAFSLQCSLFKT